jgi:hypothetical protein
MNRLHPNIQMSQFQTISHGYVIIKNVIECIPPGFENMPAEDLIGIIPSKVFKDGYNQTVIFRGGCAHYLTTDPYDIQFSKLYGTSWTGQPICYKHARICDKCRQAVCSVGNPDGLLFDDGKKKYFLCTPHFKEAEKELRSAQFREGVSSVFHGFGEGFKRGLFGGWR